jgi:excisionase family DNA binding protein
MLKISEAAEWMAKRLGRAEFSASTIRSWIMQGQLPAEKVGGHNFVQESDLEKFLPDSCKPTNPGGCEP